MVDVPCAHYHLLVLGVYINADLCNKAQGPDLTDFDCMKKASASFDGVLFDLLRR
jgi:hypothetical protein